LGVIFLGIAKRHSTILALILALKFPLFSSDEHKPDILEHKNSHKHCDRAL
jgi:hypothetical protein